MTGQGGMARQIACQKFCSQFVFVSLFLFASPDAYRKCFDAGIVVINTTFENCCY